MTVIRISKYDPRYRVSGTYTRNEWTSVSDIGKRYGEYLFVGKDYLCMENNYISCIMELISYVPGDRFVIRHYEHQGRIPFMLRIKLTRALKSGLYFLRKPLWKNGQVLSTKDIPAFATDCLRERCWGVIYGKRMSIRFGYDYYMYVDSALPSSLVVDIAHKHNLFCEVMQSS